MRRQCTMVTNSHAICSKLVHSGESATVTFGQRAGEEQERAAGRKEKPTRISRIGFPAPGRASLRESPAPQESSLRTIARHIPTATLADWIGAGNLLSSGLADALPTGHRPQQRPRPMEIFAISKPCGVMLIDCLQPLVATAMAAENTSPWIDRLKLPPLARPAIEPTAE